MHRHIDSERSKFKDFRIPVTSDVAFTPMATSATPTYDRPQDQQLPVIFIILQHPFHGP